MASYSAKQRDPLLDSRLQAAIERRSKELIGIGMVVLGVLVAMMLASYTPSDPNWLAASQAPVQNWLGRFGASIAAPLFVIVGWGSWAIAIILVVWGARFATHNGTERALGRLIFAPIAIALLSVYASTHVPSADWTHSFGLGGLFGDMVLGSVLGMVPVSAAFGLKFVAVLMGVAMLSMLLFVMGFTMPEIKRFVRFLLVGIVMVYAGLMTLLGKSARGAVIVARMVQEKNAVRKERIRADAEEAAAEAAAYAAVPTPVHRPASVVRAEPPVVQQSHAYQAVGDVQEMPEQPVRQGLLASLMNRLPDPEPELIEPALAPDVYAEEIGEDRIKARISDAIRQRVRQVPTLTAARAEPQVTRRSGRQPLLLNAEPPLEAPQMQAGAIAAQGPMMFEPTAEPAPVVQPAMAQKPVVQNGVRKASPTSRQAKAEAQPRLQFEDKKVAYEHPPLSLLESHVDIQRHQLSDEALEQNARMLENVLDDYGVKGDIASVRPGPVVTMYELEPAPGLKASRVIGLADDIARSMSALSARVSTVPGRTVIGIELPNERREKVMLREILSTRDFGDSNMRLPLALGKDIGGDPIVVNLAKMPHLLIAGTTGSGKSVAINTMILSLLYKLTPKECRLIMIDPKMLELSVYDGIPHLLSPVVTDPKKAVVALKWTVGEMEERYRKMSKMGVRNIEGYNSRVKAALAANETFSRTVQTGFDDETGNPIFETEEFAPESIPYIVVVVDEMADLMMVAGKEIEACIQRLAQMARASGIHLIMATQRPSVDVITGTIKANFPTRISFQVTSKIDSRTILGEQGAEQLLGMGDMLFMAGGAKITRVHGPFVSDEEVEEIVNHLKSYGAPEYVSGVVEGPDGDAESSIDQVLGLGGNTDEQDALYDTAVAIVVKDRKCSTSYIQRKLAIGYNKAARLVEQMEDAGLVSAANHVGKREILIPEQH
ncbi:MAG: DNA translocase FtsK 4TM domain-containing protein [Marinosulfonomonas sp.]|nr:DNA translocase FtsK 4TM domain-containing protein [Marinosulfonomonas sp.]